MRGKFLKLWLGGGHRKKAEEPVRTENADRTAEELAGTENADRRAEKPVRTENADRAAKEPVSTEKTDREAEELIRTENLGKTPVEEERDSVLLAENEKIAVEAAVVSSKGLVRSNNEDNFFVNETYMQRDEMDDGAFITLQSRDPVQLYAVFDGMGGTEAGEEASCKAAEMLSSAKRECAGWTDNREMTGYLSRISEEIYREAVRKNRQSGTTAALLLLKDGGLTMANVGDSRIYRFYDNCLTQISVDHSKVQRLVSMGVLTPEQARKDSRRHVITQFLGMPPDMRVSPYIVSREEILPGEVYLLCSDGLTDMVEDRSIEAVLREKASPRDAACALVEAALENGGRDNVTVMVLKAVRDEDVV